MQIINLSDRPSVLGQYLKEIRSVDIQADPLRFRHNIARIGWLMAYEISRTLRYTAQTVRTPLATTTVSVPADAVVLATILRAGLPLHQGFLDVFDRAENAFVSAFREESADGRLSIHVEYKAAPDLNGKTLLLVDPMLATGGSMHLAYEALLQNGTPAHLHLASVIASPQGVDFIRSRFADTDATLWVAAMDETLNDQAYIVPGLGDAGDLAFGCKL